MHGRIDPGRGSFFGRRVGAAALVPLLGCGAPSYGPRLRARALEGVGAVLEREAYANRVDFSPWPEHLQKHRTAIEAAATPDSFVAAVNGALAEFRVSHLTLLSPEEATRRSAGRGAGIGATSIQVESGLLLTDVTNDGPAADAGLRRGDVITQVDGRPASAPEDLRGELGTRMALLRRRGGTVEEATVVVRPHRRSSPDELVRLGDGSAWIAVHSFADGLYEQKRIEGFFAEAREAPGIVLDLRSNKGGNADNVRHLLGRVLPAATRVFADVYRADAERSRRASPDASLDAPTLARSLDRYYLPLLEEGSPPACEGALVVVIDRACGSGGELAPAVLQDLRRAVLLGSRTRGKVRIGKNFGLPGGYELQTPIGELVTPAGRTIEDVGLVPDFLLGDAETAEDERVLSKAREILGQLRERPPQAR